MEKAFLRTKTIMRPSRADIYIYTYIIYGERERVFPFCEYCVSFSIVNAGEDNLHEIYKSNTFLKILGCCMVLWFVFFTFLWL